MILEAAVVEIKSKLFKFKYPKFLGLITAVILAYWIFSKPAVAGFFSGLGNGWGYLGIAIAGFFFSFGFTTPFSVGVFVTLSTKNPLFAAILAGFCAMIADILIFNFVRFSFMDEFKRLEKTSVIKETSELIEYSIGHKLKVYLTYIFAGLILASPLPDEAGVIMLAGLTKIKQINLAIISLIFKSFGIFILLLI